MTLELDIETPSLILDILKRIVHMRPQPRVNNEVARCAAQVIGNHLIALILTASDANLEGRHSAALSLFRNMEDALDCFGAVALIPGAAEKWVEGKLKASEAAKLYEGKLGTIQLPDGEMALDYRKNLRSYFNSLAHCTPYLTDWDVYPYFDPADIRKLMDGQLKGNLNSELRVNTDSHLLPQNAIRIGAFLEAHTLDFSNLVGLAYEEFLDSNKELKAALHENTNKLEDNLKSNIGAVYLETPPPEIKNPRIQDPKNPERAIELSLPDSKTNHESV